MWCCKSDDKGGKAKMLCPVSLGLAIGVVGFFAVLIWEFWAMHYGMPKAMVAMHLPALTLRGGFEHALLVLLKGFIFGFFVALFYDFFACCFACKKRGK